MSHSPNSSSEPAVGWVLYDGGCGFCRKFVPFWGETLKKRGFGFAPLQSEWVQQRIDLAPDVLVSDFRLLLNDGTRIQGAEVYRFVMKRIWWAFPLYLLSILPGARWVFDRGYRAFADHRHLISRNCGLSPPSSPTDA